MKGLAIRVFLLLCCWVAGMPLLFQGSNLRADTVSVKPRAEFPGWPSEFEGKALTQLPLTAQERVFQQDFPGRIARFSDGEREIILRWINHSSRRLHPAGDCFKANGYQLQNQAVLQQGTERWSRFYAMRGTTKLLVAERIYNATGQQWSDASAWYWDSQLGRTQGPWWAVTVASLAKTPAITAQASAKKA